MATRTTFRVISNPSDLKIPAYAMGDGLDPLRDVAHAIARANRGHGDLVRNYGPSRPHRVMVCRGGMGMETASTVVGQVEFTV